jgi:hypothetical protein
MHNVSIVLIFVGLIMFLLKQFNFLSENKNNSCYIFFQKYQLLFLKKYLDSHQTIE